MGRYLHDACAFPGLVVKGKGLSSRGLGSVHQYDPLTQAKSLFYG